MFYKLAKEHHPDAMKGKSQLAQRASEEKFKEISEAYGIIGDKTKKDLYHDLRS